MNRAARLNQSHCSCPGQQKRQGACNFLVTEETCSYSFSSSSSSSSPVCFAANACMSRLSQKPDCLPYIRPIQ